MPDTWWIDRPHLIGSANPTLEDLEALRRDGFDCLISLLDEAEQRPRYDPGRAAVLGFVRHTIPVKDFQAPAMAQLQEFVGLVAGLPPGSKAIVHCEGGRGRTGTFAAAYWIAKGLTASDAVTRVREARRGAIETRAQEWALVEFAG